MTQPIFINDLYIPLVDDTSRYLILYGGADSGKSHFAAQKIIKRCLEERDHRILLIRKVQRTVRHSQFQILKDIIIQAGLLGMFEITPSNLTITGPNNNEIIGLDVGYDEKIHYVNANESTNCNISISNTGNLLLNLIITSSIPSLGCKGLACI